MANKGFDGDSCLSQQHYQLKLSQELAGEYDNFAIMFSETDEEHKLTILYDKNMRACL